MPANPLTLREREEIRYGIARSQKVTEIADRLGRHRCTISAEISRNGGRENYRAYRAHDRAGACRARPKTRLLEQHPQLAAHVTCRLEARDSPMTIAVELAQGVYPDIDQTVSHETIYREIYDHRCQALPRDVFRCLHRRRRTRVGRQLRRRHQAAWRQSMRPISERSAIAQARSEVGHLEGDLIIGSDRANAIITVFDRMSRHLWMAPLRNGRTAPKTLAGLTSLLERIPPGLRRTLTWDQGSEMANHTELAERCDIDVFFADAHSPWQRPTNENGNGLIRRYVGKSTELARLSDTDLRNIEDRINTMPRRVLGWANAKQIYDHAVAMTT